jgi:hypothetical protein
VRGTCCLYNIVQFLNRVFEEVDDSTGKELKGPVSTSTLLIVVNPAFI